MTHWYKSSSIPKQELGFRICKFADRCMVKADPHTKSTDESGVSASLGSMKYNSGIRNQRYTYDTGSYQKPGNTNERKVDAHVIVTQSYNSPEQTASIHSVSLLTVVRFSNPSWVITTTSSILTPPIPSYFFKTSRSICFESRTGASK